MEYILTIAEYHSGGQTFNETGNLGKSFGYCYKGRVSC